MNMLKWKFGARALTAWRTIASATITLTMW